MKELLLRYVFRIWAGIVWLFGAAREPRQINPFVYQVISFVLIVVIGLLLAYFTDRLPLYNSLGFDWTVVRRCFWGIVWFLLYAFVKLAVYVVELFRMEEASEFQDIDHAWGAGLRALAAKGLDLHNIPLFLVTGLRDTSAETAFLTGAGFHAIATGPEHDTPAPLRIYANQDAILVMGTGVSTVSAQQAATGTGVPQGGIGVSSSEMNVGGTLQPGLIQPGGAESPMNNNDFGSDFATLDPTKMIQPQVPMVQSANPLSEPETSRCEARIAHLSRIMSRDRFPLCPINGLIAVTPLAWTQSSRPELYRAIQCDIAQLGWSLGLQFPVICLSSGLESLGGLNDLLSRGRAADQRFSPGTRAGARYSSGQPVSIQNAHWAAGRSLAWFQQWIYACFASDCSTKGARTNGQLYRLWCELIQRRGAFATMLETGFGTSGSQTPVRLTGCYFTGFANRQFVFIRDVLNRLVNSQDQVAWTPEKLSKDASLRKWALVVWLIVVGLVCVDMALIYGKWF
jgi:hypothetical protein